MKQWNKLSASEKAKVIKFALANNVSNIDDIRGVYAQYANANGGVGSAKNFATNNFATAHRYDGNSEESNQMTTQQTPTMFTFGIPAISDAEYARNVLASQAQKEAVVNTNNAAARQAAAMAAAKKENGIVTANDKIAAETAERIERARKEVADEIAFREEQASIMGEGRPLLGHLTPEQEFVGYFAPGYSTALLADDASKDFRAGISAIKHGQWIPAVGHWLKFWGDLAFGVTDLIPYTSLFSKGARGVAKGAAALWGAGNKGAQSIVKNVKNTSRQLKRNWKYLKDPRKFQDKYNPSTIFDDAVFDNQKNMVYAALDDAENNLRRGPYEAHEKYLISLINKGRDLRNDAYGKLIREKFARDMKHGPTRRYTKGLGEFEHPWPDFSKMTEKDVKNLIIKRFAIPENKFDDVFQLRKNDVDNWMLVDKTSGAQRDLSIFISSNYKIPDFTTGVWHTGDIKFPALSGGQYKALELPTLSEQTVGLNSLKEERTGLAKPDVPEDYLSTLRGNIDYIIKLFDGKFRPFGSSVGVAEAGFPHGTHDIDGFMTRADFDNWHKKHPDVEMEQINPETVTVYPWGKKYEIPRPGKKPDNAGAIDINIINADSNGFATGERARELYEQMFPEKYSELSLANGGIPTLDMTPKQLIDAYNPTEKTILDSFSINASGGKVKHAGRPIIYLSYADADKTATALHAFKRNLGADDVFPCTLEQLSDVDANKKLLLQINFPGDCDVVAGDPKKMKNVLDYWYLTQTVHERGVRRGDREVVNNAMREWLGSKSKGGTAHGAGLNTVLMGNSGYGDHKGFFQVKPKQKLSESLSLVDKVNEIKRFAGSPNYKFSDEEIKQMQNLARKVGFDQPVVDKIGGVQTSEDLLGVLPARQGDLETDKSKNFLQLIWDEMGIASLTERTEFAGGGHYSSLTGTLPEESRIIFGGESFTPMAWDLRIDAMDRAANKPFASTLVDRIAKNKDFLILPNSARTTDFSVAPAFTDWDLRKRNEYVLTKMLKDPEAIKIFNEIRELEKKLKELSKASDKALNNAQSRASSNSIYNKTLQKLINEHKKLDKIKWGLIAGGGATGAVGTGYSIYKLNENANKKGEVQLKEYEEEKKEGQKALGGHLFYNGGGETPKVTFKQEYPNGMYLLDKDKAQKNFNWYLEQKQQPNMQFAFSDDDAAKWAHAYATEYISPDFILPTVTVTAPRIDSNKNDNETKWERAATNAVRSYYDTFLKSMSSEDVQEWADTHRGMENVEGLRAIREALGVGKIPSVESFEEPDKNGYYTEKSWDDAVAKWEASLTPEQQFYNKNATRINREYQNKFLKEIYDAGENKQNKNIIEQAIQNLNQETINNYAARSWLGNWYYNRYPILHPVVPITKKHAPEAERTNYAKLASILSKLEKIPILDDTFDYGNLTDVQRAEIYKVIREKPNIGGFYSRGDDPINEILNPYIYINNIAQDFYKNREVLIHELNHSVQSILGGYGNFLNENDPNLSNDNESYDDYLDRKVEVHSRLMEARRLLNLDPLKVDYTTEWLNTPEVQDVLHSTQLDRYSDEELLHMFNTWAQNNQNPFEKSNDVYLAADGGYLQNLTTKPFSYQPIPAVRYDWGGKIQAGEYNPLDSSYVSIYDSANIVPSSANTYNIYDNIFNSVNTEAGVAGRTFKEALARLDKQEMAGEFSEKLAEAAAAEAAEAARVKKSQNVGFWQAVFADGNFGKNLDAVGTAIAQKARSIGKDLGLTQAAEQRRLDKLKQERIDTPVNGPELQQQAVAPKTHKVVRGDSLWKIAQENGTTVAVLRRLNPQIKKDLIRPGDIIQVEEKPKITKTEWRNVDDIRKQEAMLTTDYDRILAAEHEENYGIADKKNHKLDIYSPEGTLLYSTDMINTGLSGEDYNTITYVDKDKHLISGKGNMSTPAGITEITGTDMYHGYPMFRRTALGNQLGGDLASSIHVANIDKNNHLKSNGCMRVDGKALQEISKYLGKGSKIYTLPEKEGSRYVLKDGKLSYVADNPYGNEDPKNPKRHWDDYNVYIDKTYSPLKIELKDSFVKHSNNYSDEYYKNVKDYTDALINSKEKLQNEFGLDSDTYNRLASLALGLARHESDFGTGYKYVAKKNQDLVNYEKNKKGNTSYNSYGYTQIKYRADKALADEYKKHGISEETLDSAKNSAVATMIRLAHIYNTEVKAREFKGEGGQHLSLEDVMLYKWNGRNKQLKEQTATPDKNVYIRTIKNYANDFALYSPTVKYVQE